MSYQYCQTERKLIWALNTLAGVAIVGFSIILYLELQC